MFNSYELIGKGYIHHLRPRLYLDSPGHGLVQFLQSVAVIQFFPFGVLFPFFSCHLFTGVRLIQGAAIGGIAENASSGSSIFCFLGAPWKSWKWHYLNLNPKTE
jgi:hypothetical protein